MTEAKTNFTSGSILYDPRISFESGGFLCPLKHGEPNAYWCVIRSEGDVLQIAPVSHVPVDDNDREGCLMLPVPALTINGKRVYVCVGYPTHRYKFEFDPEGVDIGMISDTLGRESLQRVLALTPVKRISLPTVRCETDTPDVNWWAIRYIRGELWNAIGKSKLAMATVTAGDVIPVLADYDPIVHTGDVTHRSAGIVQSIREWLTARRFFPLIDLV